MVSFKHADKKFVGKLLSWVIPVLILAAGVIHITDVCSRELSLALFINGEKICFVEDRSVVSEALLLLDDKLDAEGVVYSSDNQITYKYLPTRGSKNVSVEECADLLYSVTAGNYSRGFMISVSGIDIIACPTYDEAKEVVTEFEKYIVKCLSENQNDKNSVELTTKFDIKNVLCQNNKISSSSEICRTLLENFYPSEDGGSHENRVDAIGSSFLLSSDKYLSFGFVKNELPDSQVESSFSFTISGLNAAIEYKTVVIEKYSEIIPFETVYIESDELFVGDKLVVTKGENGISENEYEVSYVDGALDSKELISSIVISEPVTCIVHIGTKAYPSTEPTGSFMWPIADRIIVTSPYDVIRDTLEDKSPHLGIDIAGSIGQHIYAADGGTVIHAGMLGTYGLLVKIRHEDGVVTYYAHTSKIDVKVGDKVYKGQKIAEIGMTGATTGPHVHFEVRINGKTADPIDYLPSIK